ncbi:MAG: IS66 family insertion sequence element accessory protein TnpB [Methylococcus sp.]
MSGLIRPDALWLVVEPVDIRRGVEGLSLHVQQTLGADPCDGSAYLFRNRRGTRLKLLIWDGNGVWLCQRRLHRGHFAWPRPGDRLLALTAEQWRWLIAGVDWQRCAVPPPAGATL